MPAVMFVAIVLILVAPHRHWEARSAQAIQNVIAGCLDCFVASLLAMMALPLRGLLGLGRQFLCLGDPAFDPAGKSDLLANIVRGNRREVGDLLIVEETKIIELFLDGR
jgi:hypothetical protein